MADPISTLTERFQAAIAGALGPDHASADPVIRRSSQPQHGDFQANAAMALAKRLGRPPRDVAQEIVANLDQSGVIAKVEVAGPGFVNAWLDDGFIAACVEAQVADPALAVAPEQRHERVVIDYSSPNLAKEMQVHHLRSTIIGDALVRTFERLGHEVVRHNHFGDWGTQFGMLVEHLLEMEGEGATDTSLADLNAFYKVANQRFKDDAAFADRARQRVVMLQSGDPDTLRLWRHFVDTSVEHARAVYARLDARLSPEDDKPESAYNDSLADTVAALEELGLAREDDGAVCVFPEGFKGRDDKPFPLIIRKRDGGFNYDTTDLAAIRHRVHDLGGTLLVYVVGATQGQHLAMVFKAAEEAGWLGGETGARAVHVAFGSVLGDDGKMFRSRSGESIKLNDLLDEAVARAEAVIAEKNPDLELSVRAEVAAMVGIGAVKYADLANDRVKDYVFDWDRMLAFEGNTAPYLQYAHARIRSIFRRAESEGAPTAGSPAGPVVEQPAERELALALLSYSEAVHAAASAFQPHRLCTYLFELAQAFTAFYELCPVLKAPSETQRASRLVLCDLTARVLADGLGLLGIAAPDRM